MQFSVERFVPLNSQFKIILVSIREKAFKFEITVFFFKLDLWHRSLDSENRIYVLPRPVVSSRKLKFELLVALVRLTKLLSFCNEPLSLQHSLP